MTTERQERLEGGSAPVDDTSLGNGADGSPAADERRVLLDVMLTDQVTYPLSDFIDDGDAHAVADLLAQDHRSLSSAIADLDLYVGNLFVQVQMPDGSWSKAEVRYGADQSVEVHDV